MSSIYKRIPQKSLDIDKINNEYDAISTSDNGDIDKFKNETKTADDARSKLFGMSYDYITVINISHIWPFYTIYPCIPTFN